MKLIFLLFLLPGLLLAEEVEEHLYTYKAKVISVYDGDTITADIDLGFHTWVHGEKLRLARINAPEVRGKEKQGKYGRYIVEIYHDNKNLNDELVRLKLAIYKDY